MYFYNFLLKVTCLFKSSDISKRVFILYPKNEYNINANGSSPLGHQLGAANRV